MKKLSLILLLTVIAVALVALMVACDPPGGEMQQVYFNNAGSDIAKIYDAGTTTETVGALNSGESATFDVAISNKYDPATLTATAKNAKVTLNVTGSVDTASVVENGYTVVGKITVSDVTGTATINFSAEEAEIDFTFKISENSPETDLAGEFLESFGISDGKTMQLTYSELTTQEGFGISLTGATNGTYQLYDTTTGACPFGSDNNLVVGFYDFVSETRNQYKIWLNSNVMQLSNEIVVYPENCAKERLYVNSASGSIIDISKPADVDVSVDNLSGVTIRLEDTDGSYMTGTVSVNGTDIPITDADKGVTLEKLPIQYYSDEELTSIIENDTMGGMFVQTFNISTEADLSEKSGVCAFETSAEDSGVTFEPRYFDTIYYYDENGKAWTLRNANNNNKAEYIVEYDLNAVAGNLSYVVTVTAGTSVKEFDLNSMYELTEVENDWAGYGDTVTYLTEGNDADPNIQLAVYKTGGKILNVYVYLIADESCSEFEINLK